MWTSWSISRPEQMCIRDSLKASYTPLQGISIMIFCLIALPCIGTVTVAKREAGTWWSVSYTHLDVYKRQTLYGSL